MAGRSNDIKSIRLFTLCLKDALVVGHFLLSVGLSALCIVIYFIFWSLILSVAIIYQLLQVWHFTKFTKIYCYLLGLLNLDKINRRFIIIFVIILRIASLWLFFEFLFNLSQLNYYLRSLLVRNLLDSLSFLRLLFLSLSLGSNLFLCKLFLAVSDRTSDHEVNMDYNVDSHHRIETVANIITCLRIGNVLAS